MEKRVPHDYIYHAEIQYEGETAMRFTCAVGNTLDDLFKDIDNEMLEHQERYPEIVQVIRATALAWWRGLDSTYRKDLLFSWANRPRDLKVKTSSIVIERIFIKWLTAERGNK